MFLHLLLLAILLPITVQAKLPDGLTLLALDDKGITLELTPPPFTILPTSSCQKIQIPGWATTHEDGYPELPLTAVLMQVPATGNLNVQIIASTYENLPALEVCPARSKSGELVSQLGAAYQTNAFFPAQLVEVGKREIWRGVVVSRLSLFPFQWHPLTKELRYLSRLRLRVEFANSLETASWRAATFSDVYEELLQETLVNYVGAHFRQKEPREVHKPEDRLKVAIQESGIYQLTYKTLAEAGYQPQLIDPRKLRLFSHGEDVALKLVTTQADKFQAKDYLEFYAQGPDVYWLQWRNQQAGPRIAEVSGQPTESESPVTTFTEQLHFEQNKEEWLDTPGAPEQDYTFWQRLNGGEEHEYSLTIPSPVAETQVLMQIGWQGRSTAPPHPNHHTVVKLNGQLIGEAFWDGEEASIQDLSFSSTLLQSGDNTVTIAMPGDTGAIVDVIYLNWLTLTYQRHLEAIADNLRFTVTDLGKVQIEVSHFTRPDLVIYDVTHPNEVAEIVNFEVVTDDKKTYRILFADELLTPKTYYVTTRKKIKVPTKLATWQPTTLKSSRNAADYLLITTQSFLPAVTPLLELRQQQGLRVKAVSVEDIYNEFNEGVVSVEAIKAFLTQAYHTWQPPAPTYVFLVGSASEDANTSQVPTHLSSSEDGLTPDDNWYVTVAGEDVLPEMFIGRVPGKELAEVTHIIDKIVRFEKSSHRSPRKVLLVSDYDKEKQFTQLNDGLVNLLAPEFEADKVYLESGGSKDDKIIQKLTKNIMDSIETGVMISNYVGHGSIKQWSAKNIFTTEDVQKLNNDEQLIFAMMLTCINGHFIAGKPSLAEWFLLAKAGAIGSFASSNLSYNWENQLLAEEVFTLLFENGERNLGRLTTQAKVAAYGKGISEEAVQMYTLFGDPATSLKPWE